MPSETPPPLPAAHGSGEPSLGPATGNEWRRLHPLSPFVDAIDSALRFVVPILLVVVFARRPPHELLLLVFLVPTTIFAFLRYSFFSYRLGAEEIIVRAGVLRRTVRQVPYERIQNLDLSSSLLQRILRLSELSLETASGTEPEAVFRWIGAPEVEEIRARVEAGRRTGVGSDEAASDDAGSERGANGAAAKSLAEPLPTVTSAQPGANAPLGREGAAPLRRGADARHGEAAVRTLYEVPLRDLVLLGAFSPRGLAIFGAAFGFGWELGLFEGRGVLRWAKTLSARWTDASGNDVVVVVIAVGAAILLVSVVSIVLAVVENFGFRLSDAGIELRTRAGLFTQRSSAIPKARVQILELGAPIHLRPVRRLQLWAGTAGGRSEAAAGRSWLLPIAPRDEVARILAAVQPEAIVAEGAWQGAHPGAARRIGGRVVLLVVLLAGLLAARFGAPGLLALLLVPLAVLHARRTARRLGWALTDDVVAARHGYLAPRSQIVRLGKIQAVSVRETPFDRRWKMATLEVDTASPNRGQLRIPYLPEEVARTLQTRLAREASARRFHW